MRDSSVFSLIMIVASLVATGTFVSTEENNVQNPNESGIYDFTQDSTETLTQPLVDDNSNGNTRNEIFRYYFHGLNDKQKETYNKIVSGCENYESVIKLNSPTKEDLYIAQNAVFFDYPEFFWTESYTITTILDKVTKITYNVPSDARNTRATIDGIVSEIIDDLPDDPVEKAKVIYDWVVNNTEYGINANDQNISSVFIDKVSVCTGYSKAFQYISQKAGLWCTYVTGFTKDNEPHAWNLMQINNNYYWVDATWGDPVFAGLVDNNINYNYFLASDNEFLPNHTFSRSGKMVDGTTFDLNVAYPMCMDDSLNYYKQNNCYFSNYSKDIQKDYIMSCLKNKKYKGIELKFEKEEDYEKFMDEFLKGEKPYVFEIAGKANTKAEKIGLNYNFIDNARYVNISLTFD